MLLGDGACGFGLVEFDSFVRHGIPVIAIVGNDAGWTQIRREQVKMLKVDVGTVLARTAYEEVATGLGAEGILLTKTANVSEALARALQAVKAGNQPLKMRLIDLPSWKGPYRCDRISHQCEQPFWSCGDGGSWKQMDKGHIRRGFCCSQCARSDECSPFMACASHHLMPNGYVTFALCTPPSWTPVSTERSPATSTVCGARYNWAALSV